METVNPDMVIVLNARNKLYRSRNENQMISSFKKIKNVVKNGCNEVLLATPKT